MNTRVISISKFQSRESTLPEKDNDDENWIVIKWFHQSDYNTQEELNDSSEIFTDEILKSLSLWHFIKIEESIKEEDEEGRIQGFKFPVVKVQHKTKLI